MAPQGFSAQKEASGRGWNPPAGGSFFSVPLKRRPAGLGAGIDKDRPDYAVYCGGWEIGRIYQTRGRA